MLQGVPYHLKLCVNRGSDCFLQGEIAVSWFVNHQSINLDKWYLGASEKKLTRMLHFIDFNIHMYITWCWWMIPFICFVIIALFLFVFITNYLILGEIWNTAFVCNICTRVSEFHIHVQIIICYLPVIVIISESFKYLEKALRVLIWYVYTAFVHIVLVSFFKIFNGTFW